MLKAELEVSEKLPDLRIADNLREDKHGTDSTNHVLAKVPLSNRRAATHAGELHCYLSALATVDRHPERAGSPKNLGAFVLDRDGVPGLRFEHAK